MPKVDGIYNADYCRRPAGRGCLYRAGCNNYLAKPVAFAGVLKRLGLFISIVKVSKI